MRYTGSTPMPNTTSDDFDNYHSMPVSALNETIQKTIKNIWKVTSKYVMIKGEMQFVSVFLNRGDKSVILYFE